ncbi:MAG: hypothetical protein M3Z37_11605, partial [Candidatus Eremiobacteraeota bacterium]|nr:hypothetical protein [Candidatus Eremiobacteraeota bacterium]
MNTRRIVGFSSAVVLSVLICAGPSFAIPHATAPVTEQDRDSLIGAGTLVKVEMLQTVSSAHSRAGDLFRFRVLDNVMAGERIAVPAGVEGSGKVLEAHPARGGRTNGRLRVEFDPVQLPDGTK